MKRNVRNIVHSILAIMIIYVIFDLLKNHRINPAFVIGIVILTFISWLTQYD